MEQNIQTFIKEKKEKWLKDKMKKNNSEEEIQKIKKEAEDKFNIKNWVLEASKRAGQLKLVTHNGKMTHPDAKISIVANNNRINNGYLRSGNVSTHLDSLDQKDATGNAAVLDVYKFLSLRLDDEQTVFSHFEKGSEIIKNELGFNEGEFEEVKKGILKMKESDCQKTSSLLKQVYFPVDDGYHLLSILNSSPLMFEMKKRISDFRFSEETKEKRKLEKNNEYSETGYEEIFDLTVIGFGGTKPQNIGVLNNQNGGQAFLLPSIPPLMKKQKIRLPRKDFFTQSLYVKEFEELFENLHHFRSLDYNNQNIRQGRDRIILRIMDQIIEKSWKIRETERGWTERESYQQLPVSQKIWLDEKRASERIDSESWLDEILRACVRWIARTGEKNGKKGEKLFSDEEIRHYKSLMEEQKEAFL